MARVSAYRRARRREELDEGTRRNLLLAERALAVGSLDAAGYDEDMGEYDYESGDGALEAMAVSEERGYDEGLALVSVGTALLRSGVPLRWLLLWLYRAHGMRYHWIGKRVGLSGERARQYYGYVVAAMRKYAKGSV